MEEQIKEKKSELGNTLARLTSPAKDSADALTGNVNSVKYRYRLYRIPD